MTEPARVYVVLGESGEYSDREVWVAGVYLTEAEAQAAMVERIAVRRVYDEWARRRNRAHQQMSGEFRQKYPAEASQLGWRGPADKHPDLWAPYAERLEQAAGSRPEYEEAERCALLRCGVGVWCRRDLGWKEWQDSES